MKTTACALSALILAASTGGVDASEVSETFKKVRESVVVIQTVQKTLPEEKPEGLVSAGGLGSGVLVSEDGRIMTAAHVVQAADRLRVHFAGGEAIDARVAASVPSADLALIQLEKMPAAYQVAAVGDSDAVEVGDPVFVVGAPFGISHSLTVGVISARRENTAAHAGLETTEMFQTDAAINKGNSGGPMFNSRGEVIGIVSFIVSQTGGFEGLGFVVTSNMARRMLLEERSLWSGFQGRVLTGDLIRVFNVPQSRAMLVEVVAEKSPAVHMGLQGGTIRGQIGDEEMILGGDIILEALGVPLSAENASSVIRQRAGALRADDEIRIKVLRDGKVVELKSTFLPNLFVPAAAK